MKCYIKNCVNQREWVCMYRDDCDYCSKDCKNYYQCNSCDYYMDEDEAGYTIQVNIKFPYQYLDQYMLGEISLEAACDKTKTEVERLIREYLNNNGV